VGTFLSAAGLAGGAIAGRTWAPRLSRMQWQLLTVFAVSLLLPSWALKVFVLGN
jgi:hypothetical protein